MRKTAKQVKLRKRWFESTGDSRSRDEVPSRQEFFMRNTQSCGGGRRIIRKKLGGD